MIYWPLERRIRNVQRDGVGLAGAGGPLGLLGILRLQSDNGYSVQVQADHVCLSLHSSDQGHTKNISKWYSKSEEF